MKYQIQAVLTDNILDTQHILSVGYDRVGHTIVKFDNMPLPKANPLYEAVLGLLAEWEDHYEGMYAKVVLSEHTGT